MNRKETGRLAADIRRHGDVAMGADWRSPEELGRACGGLSRARATLLFEWSLRKKESCTAKGVSTKRGRTHIVVGDAHARAGISHERFRWLGRMVSDLEPDVVVQLGDWYDLPSQCKPASFRERIRTTLKDDLEAGAEAVQEYHKGLGSATAPTSIEHHITEGNHDWRIKRMSESEPWLDGLIDAGATHKAAGWKWHPFLEPARIDGVAYQHYVTNERGQPVSGVYQARNSLIKTEFKESLVVGHSHIYQRHLAEARGIQAVVAGCYFEHHEEYAGASNERWWRGVLVFNEVRDGRFAVDEWPMARIKSRYA